LICYKKAFIYKREKDRNQFDKSLRSKNSLFLFTERLCATFDLFWKVVGMLMRKHAQTRHRLEIHDARLHTASLDEPLMTKTMFFRQHGKN
jgi:hypothetical protein